MQQLVTECSAVTNTKQAQQVTFLHADPAQFAELTITITDPDGMDQYVPGQQYTITISERDHAQG